MTQSKVLQNFIENTFVSVKSSSDASKTLAVTSPATGEVIAHVPLSSKDDVEEAVVSAKKAFETWRYSTIKNFEIK